MRIQWRTAAIRLPLFSRRYVADRGGEYRFVATALDKVVTADPDNWPARHLLADALEQLGYEREGPQWRHAYITAAQELRVGKILPSPQITSPDLLMASRVSDLLDLLGVLVMSSKAEGLAFTINLVMTDTDEAHFIELANANLNHIQLDEEIDADTTVRITKAALLAAFSREASVEELAATGKATIEGNIENLTVLVGLLNTFDQGFPIVPMPKR